MTVDKRTGSERAHLRLHCISSDMHFLIIHTNNGFPPIFALPFLIGFKFDSIRLCSQHLLHNPANHQTIISIININIISKLQNDVTFSTPRIILVASYLFEKTNPTVYLTEKAFIKTRLLLIISYLKY